MIESELRDAIAANLAPPEHGLTAIAEEHPLPVHVRDDRSEPYITWLVPELPGWSPGWQEPMLEILDAVYAQALRQLPFLAL